MKITLIAKTTLEPHEWADFENNLDYQLEYWMDLDENSTMPEDLIEFSGRSCYQSFHKPNERTRANADYIANILRQKHESVLEHSSASFYVEGVSRNMLLELERHRHLSFSVISQRFVNSEKTEFIVPPALAGENNIDIDQLMRDSRNVYRALVEYLQANGSTRKQAREAARAILPGGLETKFVVTGNLRAWRDVLRRRFSTHADAEICLWAGSTLALLRDKVAPSVFADFPKEPFNE